MRMPSPTTLALFAAALATTVLAHADPWASEQSGGAFVSSRSAARRVLPELPETPPDDLVLELQPRGGTPVRIASGQTGGASAPERRLFAAERELGPADPGAVEGLWSSLRMATTLRAAGEADVDDAGAGAIVIATGGRRFEVRVGAATPDGVGLYGRMVIDGVAEPDAWVVEEELGAILEQAPEAWLARRTLVLDPIEVAAVRFEGAAIERGEDGLWRGGVGSREILQRQAVDGRLDRILSARLDPLVEPREGGEPWVEIESIDGRRFALQRAGACPGAPSRQLVSRGVGLWGCVDAAVLAPWPLPGAADPDAGALVDPRLAPHDYGRVLSIAQLRPHARTLRRLAGGWEIEEGGRTTDVPEPEVFRWYERLHEAEVELDAAEPAAAAVDVELLVTTDSTQTLRLRCSGLRGTAPSCRRDDGRPLLLRERDLVLAFAPSTFAERMLVELDAGDARAIEIVGASVARQSVHLDLGVWRLDAPEHPDGDAALDETRLEELLAATAGLRADAWVDAVPGSPSRTVRIERVPRQGRPTHVEIELFDDCVVRVDGGAAARVGEGACATLGRDLLADQPLATWIDRARTLELVDGDTSVRLRKDGAAWLRDDDRPLGRERARLDELAGLRATAVRVGAPPGRVRGSLRVLPSEGAAFVIELGDRWARVRGQTWWYALAPGEEGADYAPEPDPDESSGSTTE